MTRMSETRSRRVDSEVPSLDLRGKIHRRTLLALVPAFGLSIAGCGRAVAPGQTTRSGDPTQLGAEAEPSPSATTPTTVGQAEPTAAVQAPPATPTPTRVSALLGKPVALLSQDRRWVATAKDLGLSEAAGQESDPQQVIAIDEAELTSYLETLAKELDRVAVDTRLLIDPRPSVEVFPSRPGVRLDVGGTAAKIRSALQADLALEALPEAIEVELVAEVVPPQTVESDLASAQAVLERALAGPLTLRLGDRAWKLSPWEISQALSVSPMGDSGKVWQVVVADEPLRSALEKAAPEVAQSPQDARLDWNGGKLKVIRESKEGRRLDVEQSLAWVKAALVEPGLSKERAIDLVTAPVPPAVDHRRKDELGIKELIESATTSYTTAVPEKKFNINLAASRLNGVVVPPGGTFSFNQEVGPVTLNAGFRWGYGIQGSGSRLTTVPSVGGGICQVATTLFQAVFWAGYQIENRRPHSYWIAAYTSRGRVGLDTTVDEASNLDFRFTNTTPDYVLIRARTQGSGVIFSLYGKKPGWKVDVGHAVITRRLPALSGQTVERNPNLAAGKQIVAQMAREGFDVSVIRKVHEGGHVGNTDGGPGKLRTLEVRSRYAPTGTVVAVGTKR